jgi:hypothetical protein
VVRRATRRTGWPRSVLVRARALCFSRTSCRERRWLLSFGGAASVPETGGCGALVSPMPPQRDSCRAYRAPVLAVLHTGRAFVGLHSSAAAVFRGVAKTYRLLPRRRSYRRGLRELLAAVLFRFRRRPASEVAPSEQDACNGCVGRAKHRGTCVITGSCSSTSIMNSHF